MSLAKICLFSNICPNSTSNTTFQKKKYSEMSKNEERKEEKKGKKISAKNMHI